MNTKDIFAAIEYKTSKYNRTTVNFVGEIKDKTSALSKDDILNAISMGCPFGGKIDMHEGKFVGYYHTD